MNDYYLNQKCSSILWKGKALKFKIAEIMQAVVYKLKVRNISSKVKDMTPISIHVV